MRKIVSTPDAPAAIGPYSQAVRASGEFLFISGQGGLTPDGKVVEGGVRAQTEQALDNIEAILKAAGMAFGDMVSVNVLLATMDDFQTMNDVYARRFPTAPPARATSGAGSQGIAMGLLVEIEGIAVV